MNDLKTKIRQFANERQWEQFHTPKNLVMALSVETAELMEHFQWLTPEESAQLTPSQHAEVKDEIGDIMIYLTNIADKLNIDLDEAAHQKLEKAAKKYPVHKAKGHALKYTKFSQPKEEFITQ